MSRVAATTSFRSRRSVYGGKTPPNPPLHVRCPESSCLWSFKNQTDLRCHMPRHMSSEEREKQTYKCPQPGCSHQSLQKSNLTTHFNAKHSGLKPHVCKKCTYCVADPACLYRHIVALHNYAPGTVPRKGRSSMHSDSIQEPALPSSLNSDYSDLTTDAWTRSAAPSPSSATYSHPLPSPSHSSASPDKLFSAYPPSILFPCAAEFSVLPASPTSPSGWLWDNHFEAMFFPVCEKSPIVECTPSPGPSKQYPAEGIEFFDATGLFFPCSSTSGSNRSCPGPIPRPCSSRHPPTLCPRNFRIVRPRGSIRGRMDRGSVLI
ncbi:hypothetical protein DFH08DRAFT_973039 [Mycena albidolilacea]|uniref:C2H2-type domain-containing protein n=1 Tax=Mycena albidolilacea TaxID=1033008 RepID=A0AAD7EE50_9AGAR|nr:hypothetical protein DFH08DRAFT_973039 [Mycena albidolilacea]